MPASYISMSGMNSHLYFSTSLLPMCNPGGSSAQPRYLSPCYPQESPVWNACLMILAWPSPDCCRHLRNESQISLSLWLSRKLNKKIKISATQNAWNKSKFQLKRIFFKKNHTVTIQKQLFAFCSMRIFSRFSLGLHIFKHNYFVITKFLQPSLEILISVHIYEMNISTDHYFLHYFYMVK